MGAVACSLDGIHAPSFALQFCRRRYLAGPRRCTKNSAMAAWKGGSAGVRANGGGSTSKRSSTIDAKNKRAWRRAPASRQSLTKPRRSRWSARSSSWSGSGSAGLGFLILKSAALLLTDLILAAITVLCVIGLGCYGAVHAGELAVRRWQGE